MKLNKFNIIFLMVNIIALVIILSHLQTCNSNPIPVPEPDMLPGGDIQRSIDADTAQLKLKAMFDSSQVKNDSLEKVIAASKKRLADYRLQTNLQTSIINDLLNKPVTNDSLDWYVNGMKINIADFIKTDQYEDSTCSETIIYLDSQVNIKSGQILGLQKQSMNINKRLGSILDNRDSIINYSNYLKADLRKKKRANTLWKTITGAIIGLLIYQSVK